MYHISIGEYKIREGETLPTAELDEEEYEILWDSKRGEMYTVVMLDEGSVGRRGGEKLTPYVHLFWTNISKGKANIVADYELPSEDIEPHLYAVYLFKQSCTFYPTLYERGDFDLERAISDENLRGCPLSLVDKVTFYGVLNPFSKKYATQKVSDATPQVFLDAFSERHDTSKWTEEDYRIVAGSVYGIPNAKELSISEIVEAINKILLYRGSS